MYFEEKGKLYYLVLVEISVKQIMTANESNLALKIKKVQIAVTFKTRQIFSLFIRLTTIRSTNPFLL